MNTTEEHGVVCTQLTLGNWWTATSNNTCDPLPSSHTNEDSKSNLLQPIGGARAQSRFSGRTAKPIFQSPPMSASLSTMNSVHTTGPQSTNNTTSTMNALSINNGKPNKLSKQGAQQQPSKGRTCDEGLVTQPRLSVSDTTTDDNQKYHNSNNTILGTNSYDANSHHTESSRWVFNLDAWQWERQATGYKSLMSDDQCSTKHQYAIAARRWGDGRDTLAPIISTTAFPDPNNACFERPQQQKRVKVSTSTWTSVGKRPINRSGRLAQNIGFARVGGFESQKSRLTTEIINPIRYPTLCKHVLLRNTNASNNTINSQLFVRGVLLHGPSGCGKTHLVHALAEEAGVHLEVINGAECVGGGAAEERLRRAFKAAQNAAPCILFIDDIDALAPARGSTASDVERQSTALTLSLIDSLRNSSFVSHNGARGHGNGYVAVVAATSRPDALEPALRRPGRLDTEVVMGAPTGDDRVAILQCATRDMPLDKDVDLEDIGLNKLQGYMAADVCGFVLEAALHCIAEFVKDVESQSTGHILTTSRKTDHEEDTVLARLNAMAANITVNSAHFEYALEKIAHAPSVLRPLAVADVPRDVSWEDIGGLDEAKKELIEMIEWPLYHADKISAMGLPLPAGALLYGPPGCGKTLVAKAIASSCRANFISIKGPELLQKWLGESERAVRHVFERARAAAPCVVFFDEIDAIAGRRDGSGGATSLAGDAGAARVLNQLLCELDGIGSNVNSTVSQSTVFVLGATNRPAALDPALVRPGRLDRVLHIPLPDAVSRGRILFKALRKCPLSLDVQNSLHDFAAREELDGFSGADVSEFARRLGMLLVRRDIVHGGKDKDASQACLHLQDLEDILRSMRPSVSAEEVEYFNEIEGKLQQGSLSAGDVFVSAQVKKRREQEQLAGIVNALERACENETVALRARVEQLEEALRKAGVEVPP